MHKNWQQFGNGTQFSRCVSLVSFGFSLIFCANVALAAKPAKSTKPAKPAQDASTTAPTAKPRPEKEVDYEALGLKITKINVSGFKRIEEDAIREKLSSKVGDEFSRTNVRQDIEQLSKTGYFYDVEVDGNREGNGLVLTYKVTEKPAVAEIVYRGNSEVEDDDFKDAVGIKAYEILNVAKIRQSITKIQKLYEDKGFFLAQINYKLEEMEKGETVRLVFNIEENDKVKVKKINILGNKKLADGRIKGRMQTQEGGFFSFISSSGTYKQDAFDHDIQLIQYLYFNEGYVRAKVDRPQVYVTPDKKGIYITIRVEEGEQYKVGTVDFSGDLLFPKEELFEATKIDDSEIFVYETLQNDIKTLEDKYGDLGYAYVNVIPRTMIRDAEREVDVIFDFDKGNKVYFGKFTVTGNTKTRDKVVRRELTIREGELYNATRRKESQDSVKRLGFFDEVNFVTKTPPGNPDVMDVDIVVKERNTGSIQVGAGYSSNAGAIFQGSINQINFLGRGQKLGASLDVSDRASLYSLNFTEPYLWDTEWLVGASAYQQRESNVSYFRTLTGGTATFGHSLAQYLRGYIRYKYEQTDLDIRPGYEDDDIMPVNTSQGASSSATFSLEYDKRDDRFSPTKGIFTRADFEYSGLGGNLLYTKGFYTVRVYRKIFWDLVIRNNITYGFLGTVGDRDPPFSERFLLGGPNTLRGFSWRTIGKRVMSNKRRIDLINAGASPDQASNDAQVPFGGLQQLYDNLEMEFPLIAEAGVKGVVFLDVGNADDQLPLAKYRSNVGFGFRWFSPIGPLRFEWGFPLDRKPQFGEDAVNFEFAIGSPF